MQFTRSSSRARNNYVALNCAAMPESLIDAELFGYEAGAFTGARRDGSKGLIVQADGGTLFLDEIGDMPIALQTRLLRVLENREVWPLGALKPVPVDIRLISATHRDLGAHGRRRHVPVRPVLPAARHGDPAAGLARARRQSRGDRADRGRGGAELPHLARRLGVAAVLSLPGKHAPAPPCVAAGRLHRRGGIIVEADLDLPPFGGRLDRAGFAAAERAAIVEALRNHGGRVTDAARALKLSRATLYRKIKLLKIGLGG